MMTGLRVLLLDNCADTLRLATEMLAADGYTVYACSTCEHAARMVALVRPGVVLFHGCDGDDAEAFDALRTAAPHIPLVHYSAAHNYYEVFRAKSKRDGYKRQGARHHTIAGAIRAAVMLSLEIA